MKTSAVMEPVVFFNANNSVNSKVFVDSPGVDADAWRVSFGYENVSVKQKHTLTVMHFRLRARKTGCHFGQRRPLPAGLG